MPIDPKLRRGQLLPTKVADFVTLPEGNDWIPFRDSERYPQFETEGYASVKWPEINFGAGQNDYVRVNVFGEDGSLITTSYLNHNEFDTNQDNDLQYPTVELDTGKLLRDLGFRRGRFRVQFSFYRNMFGSPFPLLVNNDEKIFLGGFEENELGKIYAAEPHIGSDTNIGDRLYPKEDKATLVKISSDRTEIILSPPFISDTDYLEKFRIAAYTCLNDFADVGQTAIFSDGEDSNRITLQGYDTVPKSYINGMIRINNAYFLGNRVTPAITAEYVVEPSLTTVDKTQNLLQGRFLDSDYQWRPHSVYKGGVNSISIENPKLMNVETVIEQSPVGNQCVRLEYQTTESDSPNSSNRSFGLSPLLKIYRPIEGEEMTFSVHVKADAAAIGSKVSLLAHAGPWSQEGTTKHSQKVEMTGKWQRITLTFILRNVGEGNDLIHLRATHFPDGAYDTQNETTIVGLGYLYAGAQLELGSSVSDFTRNEDESSETIEIAEAGTITFSDPDDSDSTKRRILTAVLNNTDDPFERKMIGSKIIINDGIAVDDFSSQLTVVDTDHREVRKLFVVPDEERSIPGSYIGSTEYKGITIEWDKSLNEAIWILGERYGDRIWSSGWSAAPYDQKWSEVGTAHIGYHAQWRYGGVDGENAPCMYFPDLNYQEEILEARRAAFIAAATAETGYFVSRGEDDPRISGQYYDKEWWKHRYQAIATNRGGVSGSSSTIGPLARYGAKPGDTVRISWQQKSRPAAPNFDEGGRKGAMVRLYHWYKNVYEAPPAPVVSAFEVRQEQIQMMKPIPSFRQTDQDGTQLLVKVDGTNAPDTKFNNKTISEEVFYLRKIELNGFESRDAIGVFTPGAGFKTYRLNGGSSEEVTSDGIDTLTNNTNTVWFGKNDELASKLSVSNGLLFSKQVEDVSGILDAADVIPTNELETPANASELPSAIAQGLTRGKAIGAMYKPTQNLFELGYRQYPELDLGRIPTEPKPTSPPAGDWQDNYDISVKQFNIFISSTDWVFNVNAGRWRIKRDLRLNGWEWNNETGEWYNTTSSPGRGFILPAIQTLDGDLYFSEALGWIWTGVDWISCLDLCRETPFLALTANDSLETYNKRATTYIDTVNDYEVISFYNTGEQYYPSYDLIKNSKTLSPNGKFQWKGILGWQFQGDGDVSSDGNSATTLQWTDVASRNIDGSTSERFNKYVECFELDEWEEAHADFVIPTDNSFGLYTNSSIYVVGSRGGFGELWVDKVRIDILLTSNERVKVDQTAKFAPLSLTIQDVLGNNQLLVEEEYDEAANVQGGIQSNLAVNKYSVFGSGFQIGFLEAPEDISQVMGRYEGKILDVDGNTLIVNTSYREYGGTIGAVSGSEDSPDLSLPFEQYFVRYRIKDADNLYTRVVFGPERESLVINFKPVNVTNYPGSIAYKLLDPLPDSVQQFDTAYIVNEVTPDLFEGVDLIPFIDEVLPETVLKAPKLDEAEPLIRRRETEYRSHTDLVGVELDTRKQLEDKIFSGSLLDVSVNVDYNHFQNFSHFGSVEKRIRNFKDKLTSIELHTQKSQSLGGTTSTPYITGQTSSAYVSGSSDQQEHWDLEKRKVINGFDDFENFMYFKSSSYISSSNGIDYDNAAPKSSGDGTLTSPYQIYSVSSSNFTSWFDNQIVSASTYDNTNMNRLVNLTPAHISYDSDNESFIRFMDMMGHHYDIIWTHIKAMTDSHDRSEDITKGISAELVKPIAESLGFKMQEGKDLVRLPEYQLGLQESGSNTGVFNVRFSKKSQQDISREIWNRLLSSMPYLLKTKGTKQGLKGLIAAYGIPTSILRIQEYGGPKIEGGTPEFEIKQKYTYALHLKGSQQLASPWYRNAETQRVNDTIEFRFKTGVEQDTLIASKNNTTNHIESAVYIKNVDGQDTKGKLSFALSGSEGFFSASLDSLPMYNDEYWSVMIRRRAGESGFTSSYDGMQMTSETSSLTQSFDIFAGYYDSGVDEIITKASASIDVSGSSALLSWYASSSTGDNYWHIGGRKQSSEETALYGSQYTGSIMEWRYWQTPLTESAFFNHVSAPKAVNGNHPSSSFYDMNLRFSMDDKINLNSSPNGIRDYSLTGDQLYATGSGFADEINFESVSDRQKAFTPSIGLNKTSNKIRIEDAKLKFPDGADPVLSTTERVELSSYDTAPLDSNKLGIFFAPSDVINEDIILSVADLDFGSYLGDPRDMYAERYDHGKLDRIADTYWQKWTTKFNFWNYLKLIKYYDLSLFDHLRNMSPARAKKNIGILIEPTILERPKVIVGNRPFLEDKTFDSKLDVMAHYSQSGDNEFRKGNITYAIAHELTSSNDYFIANPITGTYALKNEFTSSIEEKRGKIDTIDFRGYTGSRDDQLVEHTWSFLNEVSTSAAKSDYGTVSSSQSPYILDQLRSFGSNPLIDPLERDYANTDNKVHTGGGSNVFFEILQPTATGSVLSHFNDDKIYHYSSSVSKSLGLYYSQSLEVSDIDSIFTTHTGLFNLAYGGCQEDGLTVPEGNEVAVEILDVNPYAVTATTSGDSFVDVQLDNE